MFGGGTLEMKVSPKERKGGRLGNPEPLGRNRAGKAGKKRERTDTREGESVLYS